MNIETLNNILTSIIGVVGVFVGAIFTKLVEKSQITKVENEQKRKTVIANMNQIQEGLNGLYTTTKTIGEFIQYDFNNLKNTQKTIEIITRLAGLNLEITKKSWELIREDVYLYFPQTLSSEFFSDFEYFISEIYSALIIDESKIEDMAELQKMIKKEYGDALIYSYYVIMIMQIEFRSIITNHKIKPSNEMKLYKKEIESKIAHNNIRRSKFLTIAST